MTPCHCAEGWVCEHHRDRPWRHDGCRGPGTLCANPACIVGRVLRAELDDQRQHSAWLRSLARRESGAAWARRSH